MRMSQLLLQTLREAPSEARAPGYQFLQRGGYLRLLPGGDVAFLPLGVKAKQRIAALAIAEIEKLGGQPIALPLVQPIELVGTAAQNARQAGQRFRDRSQREVVLSRSHIAASLAAAGRAIQSYRQLPVFVYESWRRFSETDRPAGGLFGVRESDIVEGCSLHSTDAELVEFYPRVLAAFQQIFEQCALPVVAVEAAMGPTGRPAAHSLVLPHPAGAESVVTCQGCGYAARQSIATTRKEYPAAEEPLPLEDVATPDCKTITDLAQFLAIPESRTEKAIFLVASYEARPDQFVFVVVRGDTSLSEEKLKQVLGAVDVGAATEAEIRAAGAEPGYGSPLGLSDVLVVADDLVVHSPNLVAGANRPGYHTRNVNHGRDYRASIVTDLVLAETGSACPKCGARLQVETGIELASMELVGMRESERLEATYLDRDGRSQSIACGRYQFDIDKVFAATAEIHNDAQGLLWPFAATPFHIYLMTVGKASVELTATADSIYIALRQAGFDVLYDDRDERAGVKFNDSDLLGIPLRIAVGDRGLKAGSVEVKKRGGADIENVPLNGLIDYIRERTRA